MSDKAQEKPIPRAALLGGAALIGLSLALAVLGKQTGIGTTSVPAANAVMARDLRFADSATGDIVVRLAPTNETIAVLPPGTNGFVRVVMRGLARHRKQLGLGDEKPFRLTYWDDNRLSIQDPVTGRKMQLGAFGGPNRMVFSRLLVAKVRTQ